MHAALSATLSVFVGLQTASWAVGPEQVSAPSGADAVASRITVTLPREDAELLVNDEVVEGIGTVRRLQTSPLDSRDVHEYRLTARWRPNTYTAMTRNRTVILRPGTAVAVDFATDDPTDRAEIRYVPTPNEIVSEMIELAGLSERDVVYEPGCGDARIVIAAVKAGAHRGIGIDISPERVAESLENVRAANLEDRIDIRLGDALDVEDLSDVTVVFLYMGDEFNMLIRPILWKQLPVGARVVSHRFTMGDWRPDRTIEVTDTEEYGYGVHLWTITEAVKARAPAW